MFMMYVHMYAFVDVSVEHVCQCLYEYLYNTEAQEPWKSKETWLLASFFVDFPMHTPG